MIQSQKRTVCTGRSACYVARTVGHAGHTFDRARAAAMSRRRRAATRARYHMLRIRAVTRSDHSAEAGFRHIGAQRDGRGAETIVGTI